MKIPHACVGLAPRDYQSALFDQRIRLSDCLSSKAVFTFGVPRGSVLGPLLFTLYTTPLSIRISGHAITHHFYAHDSHAAACFLYIRGFCCVTEWFAVMLGLCPVMYIDE